MELEFIALYHQKTSKTLSFFNFKFFYFLRKAVDLIFGSSDKAFSNSNSPVGMVIDGLSSSKDSFWSTPNGDVNNKQYQKKYHRKRDQRIIFIGLVSPATGFEPRLGIWEQYPRPLNHVVI